MNKKNKKNIKILLTGGGTGGSVAPLLAIHETWNMEHETGSEFLWLGTKHGLERNMVKDAKIQFKAIFWGKLRRYWSWRNFIDPFLIVGAFFQSLYIIKKWKPDMIMSAGSFISVPVVWAAWILRAPVLIHQQDARPGLANKLMAPFAAVVTVSFEKSLADYGEKARWIGNFIRPEISKIKYRRDDALRKLGLNPNLPAILIMGGGTGAAAINELVWQSAKELTKFCQIIHITGKDKFPNYELRITNYKNFEFLHVEGMAKAFSAADIIVSRCGMSVLTELVALGKPAVLIPMPDSHQEDNASVFYHKQAVIVLDQNELTPKYFTRVIKKIIDNEDLYLRLSSGIKTVIKLGANKEIIKIIEELLSEPAKKIGITVILLKIFTGAKIVCKWIMKLVYKLAPKLWALTRKMLYFTYKMIKIIMSKMLNKIKKNIRQ